ncbi:cyclase [Mycobacterium sp. 852002-51163_SCH5372311]|nr:cyclase [Mycobacterium sp. 852002-51163_SCH5372311]
MAPSGVVTFLFTDIEGSTRRWEADADGMRYALAVHDDVPRTAIEDNGGFVFSHSGDGVAAAFASPRSAVDAAVQAQLELELPVRMGIATGEAELRDGDYFGVVLNRAARVMAAGHGGQVLLAESTASLLHGVDLIDLGPRRLRDVPVPVGLFQLRATGLRTDFPPLRALDTVAGNLRPVTTSLIGREAEVEELGTAVRSDWLVTLTGVGGVGKTRLALEVAARLASEFADGVWVFELAAVTDPAAVPDAVAAVLGVNQQPSKTVSESIAAALEGRIRLLVFDNCEHVLDAAADLIDTILKHSVTVRVLATSREGLGLAQERVRPVRSLDAAAGIDSPAVTLFVERAQGIAPGFSMVDSDEAAAVTEICQRLDGIPLAIELAASRMASMTASEVRDRLDHRFRLLVGSRRGLERHQTLRHAVSWSYDLLDDAEKMLLHRCSVFAGGFGLESACAAAGFDGNDEYAVLYRLDALVRKSLLVVDRSAGRSRFSMLETIRQFAEEQLAATGEVEKVRTAHAHHFAGKEADILALWDSPRQLEAYDWFTTELANLRTAFRWAADHGNLDASAAIATYAAFLGFWLENYEPTAWAEETVDPARAVDHPRLVFLYAMAAQCWIVGRIEEALQYSDAGQAAMRAGRGEVPFGVEGVLANSYLTIGQPDRAVEWCRARLATQRAAEPRLTAYLATLLTIAGSDGEAIATVDGLVDAAEATCNPHTISLALMAYGFAWRSADPDRALEAMRRGLSVAHDSGNRFNESHIAANLAQVEVERDDPLSALDHISLAIRHLHDSGNIVTLRSRFTNLAILLDRLEHYEPAATIAGFAVSPLTAASFPKINAAITHLREVLGEQTYESLARKGAGMSAAAITRYAFDQIDQARAELHAASKSL